MALEYSIEGNRLVDFDLYYKNKKIYWYEVNKNRGKGKTKLDEAKSTGRTCMKSFHPKT